MEQMDRIDFSLGADMGLKDILGATDVLPLLKAIVGAGADLAAVTDSKGKFLWAEGNIPDNKELPSMAMEAAAKEIPGKPETLKGVNWRLSTIHHEAEPIGLFFVSAPEALNERFLSNLMETAFAGLNIIIRNIVKRVFTTELHTTVVKRSYEELLETNRNLAASEKKYKELSETLEQKVEERTAELKKAHTRLLQQEKMASIGQLAASVAHEINNPIGFIYSNLNTLKKYIGNLNEIIQFYKVKGQGSEVIGKEAEELYKKLRIDFIKADIHDLIKQSIDGAERIKNIVANLKGFSHIDEAADREMNINAEMDNTISVLSNEIKDRSAKIVKQYGQAAGFFGNTGLICQAFLNILLNALQSGDDNLIITVKTEQRGDNAVIFIADNGRGIPPEIQDRIFEPFFTTRDVGKGTGMGLAVTYDIISQYRGSIEVKSEMGKGSTFVITLPLKK
ncbi:MAG: histidine kinase [Nitrospirae bacterium]|nr:histidine kinase [Nitrospirota bacterium]